MPFKWGIGVSYQHGKILIYRTSGTSYKSNPGQPSWAVDIREIIAMLFAGTGGLCLIFKGFINEAMVILVGLMFYATGRTIPGGKPTVSIEEIQKIVREELDKIKT
jgi:hypothetical protein